MQQKLERYLSSHLKYNERTTSNYMYFSFTGNENSKPYFVRNSDYLIGNSSLTIGKWQHLAFTFKVSTLSI